MSLLWIVSREKCSCMLVWQIRRWLFLHAEGFLGCNLLHRYFLYAFVKKNSKWHLRKEDRGQLVMPGASNKVSHFSHHNYCSCWKIKRSRSISHWILSQINTTPIYMYFLVYYHRNEALKVSLRIMNILTLPISYFHSSKNFVC